MENINTKFRNVPIGEIFFHVDQYGEKVEYRKVDIESGKRISDGKYVDFYLDDDVKVMHRAKFVLNT